MTGTLPPPPWAPPRPTDHQARAAHRRAPRPRRRGLVVAGEVVVGLHLLQVAATSDLSVTGRLAFAAVVVALVGSALALSLGRGGPRALGILVAGLLGTLSGAAIGIMHAIATGFSMTALLGVAALAVGLVLLVVGVAAAIRVLPGWWRLLAVPAAVVVVQLVVLTLPFALYVTHVPIEPTTATPPEGTELVRLDTADGTELAAWYTPSTNGAAVLLRHGSGAGSSKASTGDHAAVLARHGYGVLAMDARGHGQSGGQPMDWGWYGELDVAAGVAWLAGRAEVDPERIGGVGLSMGGEELLGAAGGERRLRAVVGEGVTGRTAADRGLLGFTGYARVVDEVTSAITFGTADVMTRAGPATPLREAVEAMTTQRVLLVTGEEPQEATAGRHLREAAAPGVVTLWELPDTAHTAALARDPAAWEARVLDFLDRTLD
jgi:uncharacterized protein